MAVKANAAGLTVGQLRDALTGLPSEALVVTRIGKDDRHVVPSRRAVAGAVVRREFRDGFVRYDVEEGKAPAIPALILSDEY